MTEMNSLLLSGRLVTGMTGKQQVYHAPPKGSTIHQLGVPSVVRISASIFFLGLSSFNGTGDTQFGIFLSDVLHPQKKKSLNKCGDLPSNGFQWKTCIMKSNGNCPP